jgi:hypothetical protein
MVNMDRELLLQEILRLPWRTVLTEPLVPHEDQPSADPVSAMTCAMTVRGAWCGRLVVSCDRSFVETLARRLQGRIESHDQVQAIHWLTIALGGALRPVLPSHLGFGFPVVIDDEPEWARAEPTVALHFTSGDSVLSLALYPASERDDAPPGSDQTRSSDGAANEPPVGARSVEDASTLTGT